MLIKAGSSYLFSDVYFVDCN